jgi:outer membrane protein OmpA-like peptidoglycan-associated protein
MSSYAWSHQGRAATMRCVTVAVLFSVGALLSAQDLPSPKWELYGGYSFVYPGANVYGILPFGILPVTSRLESNPRGIGAGVTYDFNRWLGVTVDASGHWGSGEDGVTNRIDDAAFYNISAGPKLTYRSRFFSPFVEVLAGGHRLTPDLFHRDDRFGFMAGGGLDVNLNRHFTLRPIRADYVFSNHHFGPDSTVPATNVRGVRLQSGVVFLFGGAAQAPPPPLSYSCSVSPLTVFPGEPVTVTGTATNINPKKMPSYTWSTDHGVASGTSNTANIDTKGLSAGAYNVRGHVSEGTAPGEMADCSAAYSVKAFEPPTVTCSANPASVKSGTPSSITANGMSPQNRPLTYSYTSNAGSITGTGASTTLDTTGAASGAITVTCNVADDLGQTASQPTTVTVEMPQVAAKPVTSSLCSISFGRDAGRPTRVDNEAKACLDEIALSMQRNADATMAIVGNAESQERNGKELASERAMNVKSYLTTEKGIDSSRVALYTGSQDAKAASATLIPVGATLDPTGISAVDERAVNVHAPAPARRRRK